MTVGKVAIADTTGAVAASISLIGEVIKISTRTRISSLDPGEVNRFE